MKRSVLLLAMLVNSAVSFSQGLENIIVETYYISDANDTSVNADGGALPVGSVTYRVFADMLPGYRFQACYGVPDHELRIETSTLFFNNEDRGATSPTYTKNQAQNNTVMLDSWLSVGAACAGHFGILKTQDDGMSTVINGENPQVLQNADPLAGIPLSQQDGLIAGSPEPVTIVGINTEISVFDNQNDGTNGPVFSTWNGSWASLNGSTGPDSMDNKVLLAQITTNGTFSFELNIQIGTPSGGVEQYVARNPVGSEILFTPLIYNSLTANIHQAESKNPMFIVFPNPANEVITLKAISDRQTTDNRIVIYGSNGRIVLQKELRNATNNSEEIDLSFLSKGLYMIRMISDGSSSDRKIILN